MSIVPNQMLFAQNTEILVVQITENPRKIVVVLKI